jgi:hypothetical protein
MEIITNEAGGKQSKIRGKFTEIPPYALIEVSEVMGLGSVNYPREEDGTPNWHNIDCFSNLDHAGEHLANFLKMRNRSIEFIDHEYIMQMREELSHFAARAMMALEMFIKETE